MFEQLKTLQHPQAPRVFTPQMLSSFFEEQQVAVSTRSLTSYLAKWVELGLVEKAVHGVFLNKQVHPKPLPDEAAPFVRNKAVVSLQRVLGNSGVLNNPSHWITCVLPYGSGIKEGVVQGPSTTYHFTKLHPSLFPTIQDPWFKDAIDLDASYLCATPEKALMDWLYLSTLTNGHAKPLPPRYDLDLEVLDEGRLERLAEHMKLQSQWQAWQEGKLKSTRALKV